LNCASPVSRWPDAAHPLIFGVQGVKSAGPFGSEPASLFFVHTNQHWDGYIGVVVNLDFGLVLVEAMQATYVLLQCTLPGNRRIRSKEPASLGEKWINGNRLFSSQMILNHLIPQRQEYPRLAPNFLSIFRFYSLEGMAVHHTCRPIAGLAALTFHRMAPDS